MRFSRSPRSHQGSSFVAHGLPTVRTSLRVELSNCSRIFKVFNTGNLYKDHLGQSDTRRSFRCQYHHSSTHTPCPVQAFRAWSSWWFPAHAPHTVAADALRTGVCLMGGMRRIPGSSTRRINVPHGKWDRFRQDNFLKTLPHWNVEKCAVC